MSLFKTATVNAASVAATVTDFPVYVDLARVGMTTLAQAQSSRWYTDSAKINEIPREIVSAGEGHGKYPSLTATSQLFIDYDGIRADYAVGDTYGRNAVWSGYTAVWHLNESSGTRVDSTGNSNLTDNNTVTQTTGKLEDSAQFTRANSEYLSRASDNSIDGVSSLTVQSWVYADSFAATYPVVASVWNDSVNSRAWSMAFISQQPYFYITQDGTNATLSNVTSGATLSTGAWHHLVGTFNGSTGNLRIYVNNTQYTNATGRTGVYNSPAQFRVGFSETFASTLNLYWDGRIDEMRIRSNELPADWITTEYNNQNDEATFWGTWSDVGGATNETIEPAQGTYSLTGQAVTLRVNRKVAPVAGTYTVTGYQVGISQNAQIIASQATYSLTGNSIGLTVNRTISATQGSYTLTGQNTGLLRGRTIALEGTEYAQTGFSVGLRISRHLAINQGAYSLTGHDTQFSRDYRLPATTGTYTLTGYQVGVSTTPQMVASQGNYTLSGNAVGLSVTRKLTTDQGTYTLTGQIIDTARGYSIQPTTGTYTLTGQPANLLTATTLTAEAGTYSLTGNDTGLARRYSLAPTTGDYTLTGQVVILGNQPLVRLTQGQYDLDGQEVRLVKYAGACPPTFRAKGRPFTDRASVFTPKASPFSDKCGG